MPRQNTGSVFQRKDGLWAAQINRNGKRIVEYANSQQEAEQLRQRLLSEPFDRVVITEPVKPTRDEPLTLSNFLQQYLGASDLKPTTRYNVGYCFKLYICPTLGDKPLSNLSPLDIANLITTLKTRGLGGTTVRTVYDWLSVVLNAAVQWELIRSNPAAKVKTPKKTVKPKPVWTVAQTQEFITCCQTQVIKWEPLFLVALNTGLRIGELLGLQWKDIDYQRKTLKVERSLAELPPKQFIVQTPKSKSSIRTISLSQIVFDALETWEPDKAKRVGFVFYPDNKHPHQDNIFQSLKRTCRRAGVAEMSVHGLRHQHISLLAHAGVSVKAAQIRAGHSSPMMTLQVYTHVLDETDTTTVTALDKLFAVN